MMALKNKKNFALFWLLIVTIIGGIWWSSEALAAPAAELWPRWQAHSPKSPRAIDHSPWDAKLMIIEGQEISLNDIEHRILRPIFNDNRLHYALNCASLGCPNLQPVSFSPANTDELLELAAREYINSPRGAQIIEGTLHVSSIYKWFQADFGGSEAGVMRHLRTYAQGTLAETVKSYKKGLRFEYDWNLNQP